MNKKILSFLLAIVVIGTLVGCGASNTDSKSDNNSGNTPTKSTESTKK